MEQLVLMPINCVLLVAHQSIYLVRKVYLDMCI